MTQKTQKQQVTELLKAIETGAAEPVGYINAENYKQHNLAIADGLAGFGATLQALPAGSAHVNTVRVFQDGDYVFAHTDYNFFGDKIGFDIFRFESGVHSSFYDLFRVENGKIAEHWDTIEPIASKETWKNQNGKFNF